MIQAQAQHLSMMFVEVEVPAGQSYFMCATINTTPTILSGTGELILDQECGCPV
jgi:hypothetical protein